MATEEVSLLIYSPLSVRMGAGGDRWISEVVPRLDEFGIRASVLATNFIPKSYRYAAANMYLDKILSHGIQYNELKAVLPNILNTPLLPPESIRKFYKRIACHDVLYFLNAYFMQDIIVWISKKFDGTTPIISSQHASIWQKGLTHNLYLQSVSRRLLKHFDAHHVLNEADYNTYRSWNINEVYLVPNGVNTSEFVSSFENKLEKFTVLFVGRLDFQKGIDVLLNAIKILELRTAESASHSDFIICGTGPLKNSVYSFASHRPNFHAHGYVSEDRLHSLYASSSVFVMPSRRETFGLVGLEAMASGLPIIVTNISGPRSYADSSFAQIIPPNDSKSLANAIDWFYNLWIDSPSEYKRMSNEARMKCEKDFEWRKVAEKLSEIIRSVAEK